MDEDNADLSHSWKMQIFSSNGGSQNLSLKE
jgi:hypothetical protein